MSRAFASNANTGMNLLVSSFEIGADLPLTSGQEVVMDIAAAGSALPVWWQFKNAGSCRQAALAMNSTPNARDIVCNDWASGQAAGGIGAYIVGVKGPSTARVVVAIAVPASALADQYAGLEYFSNKIIINITRTVGTVA